MHECGVLPQLGLDSNSVNVTGNVLLAVLLVSIVVLKYRFGVDSKIGVYREKAQMDECHK